AASRGHRIADVDDHADWKILVLFEQADECMPEADPHRPVEIADVVAGRVLAVVRELEAAAHLASLSLRALSAAEQPSRDDLQELEPGEELLVEQVVVVAGGPDLCLAAQQSFTQAHASVGRDAVEDLREALVD